MEPAKKMENQEAKNPAEQQPNVEIETTVEQGSTGRGRRRRSQSRPEMPVNMDELRELIQLIRENEFTEFEFVREDFRIRFRRGGDAGSSESAGSAGRSLGSVDTSASSSADARAGAVTATAHPGAKAQTEALEDQDLHIIPSPIVGTFYRSPSPNADSFVKIGSPVEADTVVCIIEAMKLMNEIQAETTGEVAKIYVENGQPVEYGQPLFGIKK